MLLGYFATFHYDYRSTLFVAVTIAPDVIIRDYDIASLNGDHSLECLGVITSSIPSHGQKLHLESYTNVEWSDNSGVILSRENIMVTNYFSNTNGVLKSIVSFHPLSAGHDQLYTCSMTVDIETFVQSDTVDYRVIVGK